MTGRWTQRRCGNATNGWRIDPARRCATMRFGRPTCLLFAALTCLGAPAAAQPTRSYIYGCGLVWGKWLGLPEPQAMAFDRRCMDAVVAMGGTNVPANFAWIDIEPRPGEYHWSYVDHQVSAARARGLEIFAYTGLTPDWALPPEAPAEPGIGYRFPPDERYAEVFERFFTTLARRYRGRVRYYEFWNEPNGCGWINDGGANGHMAPSYAPWLQRWYRAMKAGDPHCVLAVGGLDYHQGVKEGWRYLEDLYAAGAGDSFDAVALHPYGQPLHWQAIHDTYAVLVRHGHGHKRLWLNEYGWNTSDEATKARYLRTVLRRLASPEFHMVFQASYLTLTDLPGADDQTGHDFGLCGRDRRAGLLYPRASYEAFRDLPKRAPQEVYTPPGPARRGPVPPGFLLAFTAPGVEPGQPGDDQGPPYRRRRAHVNRTGCNLGGFGIHWGATEPQDPGDGPSRYDFSGVRPDPWDLRQPHVIVYLDHMGNPWADRLQFTAPQRYHQLLERWAEAACRFARERYGATRFEAGGNERDLVAPETYRPHYPDWHYFYMAPLQAIHRGMKRAHPDNSLMIGNLCYSDRNHIGALYDAGAKGNFELLAIHAYGPRGCGLDMEQVVESHEELAYRGDPNIPIMINEGWSAFPLPDSIDDDPAWRRQGRAYTPQEIEHYRQTVLDGWRNLLTPRPGEYDPAWVLGARYFVLNDHWGGRGWEARAQPRYGDDGQLQGFLLDGYFIGTNDPLYIKPFLRPWGLIDINGVAKGDTIAAFPPYLPRHRLTATLAGPLPRVGYDPRRPELTCPAVNTNDCYRVTVEYTNLESTPVRQCHFRLTEKNEADFPGGYAFVYANGVLHVFTAARAQRLVKARLLGPPPPRTVGPGETVRLQYEIRFSERLVPRAADGRRQRVRPYVDLYYLWDGRPYHTDAWLPRVAVLGAPGGVSGQEP